MSSSRVNCTRTGARPLIALATLTAATVKSLQALARRPKLPPENTVCSLTLLRRQARRLGGEHVVEARELVTAPGLEHAVVQPGDAIHRLHRRVSEEGELVDRLDRLDRAAGAGVPAAGRANGLPRLAGFVAEEGEDLVGVELAARRFIPLHLERVAALQRRPGAAGDHGDTLGHLHHVGDALHLLRRRGVEGHQLGAEARREGDHRGQQAGELDVDGVDRACRCTWRANRPAARTGPCR